FEGHNENRMRAVQRSLAASLLHRFESAHRLHTVLGHALPVDEETRKSYAALQQWLIESSVPLFLFLPWTLEDEVEGAQAFFERA
ncbi:MAG TPA: hypothetical protein VFC15_05870, partial [Candidatus Limnocylindrales bacterium]|nr:hypothetical protein [Candidatus Limnocylindrales bacterium]